MLLALLEIRVFLFSDKGQEFSSFGIALNVLLFNHSLLFFNSRSIHFSFPKSNCRGYKRSERTSRLKTSLSWPCCWCPCDSCVCEVEGSYVCTTYPGKLRSGSALPCMRDLKGFSKFSRVIRRKRKKNEASLAVIAKGAWVGRHAYSCRFESSPGRFLTWTQKQSERGPR